jgi:hypothetical protein
MSFVSNGGKFKLYTVLNGLIFPRQDFISMTKGVIVGSEFFEAPLPVLNGPSG